MRHSSPTRAQCRLPPPASSAAPTSTLTDAHLCPRRSGPPRLAAPAAPFRALIPPQRRPRPALLLGGNPRQSSSSAVASCSRYVAPTSADVSAVGPLCGRRQACVCPMVGRAARGFALLTSAREILASASIFN
jgi:hypothetical protein